MTTPIESNPPMSLLEEIQEAEAAAFAAEMFADSPPPKTHLTTVQQEAEAAAFADDMSAHPSFSPSTTFTSLVSPPPQSSSSCYPPSSVSSNSSLEWSLPFSPTILGHHRTSQSHTNPLPPDTTFIPSPTTSLTSSSPPNPNETCLHPKTLFPP